MTSTLYGIYTAQRSIAINQAAMDVINNNISNMNTVGYSKEKVDISELSNSPSSNPADASETGMGAAIDGISRNRDVFLDNSFRKSTTDQNYYKQYNDTAVNMESSVNELSGSSLSSSLTAFYSGLSQLAANPSDYVTRSSLVQSAVSLTTQFNNTDSTLQTMRTGLVGDINNPSTLNSSKLGVDISDLNNKLSAVANLNSQINLATSQGTTPNALLDQRDILLDGISKYIPVTITNEKNNTATVTLGNIDLVKGSQQEGSFELKTGDINNPAVVQIKNDGGSPLSSDASSLITSGEIAAVLQAGGSDPNKLTVKGMMDSLNTLASQFAGAVNTLQTGGRYIDNSVSPNKLSDNLSNPLVLPGPGTNPDPVAFFTTSDLSGTITAGNIKVNDALVNNPYQIAAASLSGAASATGDGSNALLMSQAGDQSEAGLGGVTVQGFLTNIAGKMGTQAANIKDNFDLKDSVLQQVTQQRESVTGVSLDEELTDLVKFQRSYEASAKIMTTLNQNLTTIINMMG